MVTSTSPPLSAPYTSKLLVVCLALGAAITAAAPPFLSKRPSKFCSYSTELNDLGNGVHRLVLGSLAGANSTNSNDDRLLQSYGQCGFLQYDPAFGSIVSINATIGVIASKDEPFAHEAAVYLPKSNKVFFTSNRLGNTSSGDQYVDLYTISLDDGSVAKLDVPNLLMGNGATRWYGSSTDVAVLSQGLGMNGGGIYRLNLDTLQATVVLDNWQGLQFNSPNDIVFAPDGSLLFTDPAYGYEQLFRPPPQLGNFLWTFNPAATGVASPLADGFIKPNGAVFSADFRTLYVSDTGFFKGTGVYDVTQPHAIYAYGVSTVKATGSKRATLELSPRRLFAISDTGIPDGLKVDTRGNVYAGVGDGVSVWAPDGKLLGKFLVGSVSNFVITDNGLLVMLQEKEVTVVQLSAKPAPLP